MLRKNYIDAHAAISLRVPSRIAFGCWAIWDRRRSRHREHESITQPVVHDGREHIEYVQHKSLFAEHQRHARWRSQQQLTGDFSKRGYYVRFPLNSGERVFELDCLAPRSGLELTTH